MPSGYSLRRAMLSAERHLRHARERRRVLVELEDGLARDAVPLRDLVDRGRPPVRRVAVGDRLRERARRSCGHRRGVQREPLDARQRADDRGGRAAAPLVGRHDLQRLEERLDPEPAGRAGEARRSAGRASRRRRSRRARRSTRRRRSPRSGRAWRARRRPRRAARGARARTPPSGRAPRRASRRARRGRSRDHRRRSRRRRASASSGVRRSASLSARARPARGGRSRPESGSAEPSAITTTSLGPAGRSIPHPTGDEQLRRGHVRVAGADDRVDRAGSCPCRRRAPRPPGRRRPRRPRRSRARGRRPTSRPTGFGRDDGDAPDAGDARRDRGHHERGRERRPPARHVEPTLASGSHRRSETIPGAASTDVSAGRCASLNARDREDHGPAAPRARRRRRSPPRCARSGRGGRRGAARRAAPSTRGAPRRRARGRPRRSAPRRERLVERGPHAIEPLHREHEDRRRTRLLERGQERPDVVRRRPPRAPRSRPRRRAAARWARPCSGGARGSRAGRRGARSASRSAGGGRRRRRRASARAGRRAPRAPRRPHGRRQHGLGREERADAAEAVRAHRRAGRDEVDDRIGQPQPRRRLDRARDGDERALDAQLGQEPLPVETG